MAQIQNKDDTSDEDTGLGYQNTLMYGRYQKDLSETARLEARRLRRLRKRRLRDDKRSLKELAAKGTTRGKISKGLGYIWKISFARLGEDWIFLALLGIIVAIISFVMDRGIAMCNNARMWMYKDLTSSLVSQYLAWVTLPTCLILFSAGFVHIVAPQSIGSGIPEMKTILRGVQLKEYLTFRTLVAKVIGLTATLGSGLPLGKEGPSVHIASMVASLLSKLVTSFQGIYANESRTSEMLAAACAAGVAACFASPVGGVLFSIEVTTTYFAVRNYWRGFFAACCGATMFRLLSVWTGAMATVKPLFPTHFGMEFPFDPQELFVFALIGVIAGLIGAAYVFLHRKYVLFMRNSKRLTQFLQKNRFIYPGIVVVFASSVTFPPFLGKYMASTLGSQEQVLSMFSNFTWSGPLSAAEATVVSHWEASGANIYLTLFIYLLSTFFLSIVASTIPVPSGIFIPSFKMGAALGRLVGEAMHLAFPFGVSYGASLRKYCQARYAHFSQGSEKSDLSGSLSGKLGRAEFKPTEKETVSRGYACVGAAAVAGAVTHTVSTVVIMFEMTGQVTHIVPCMTAVLIANGVAALLQPSAFDSIILIKKLPYLPDLISTASRMYDICVEDFMVRDVRYIWNRMTFQQLKDTLKENKAIKSFPLVDSPTSMVLLGSIQRWDLVKVIEKQVGRERRLQVAAMWHKEAEAMRKKEEEAQKRQRRPSRFEVSPAPDILALESPGTGGMTRGTSLTTKDKGGLLPSPGQLFRPKSILKKTNSFTMVRPGGGSTTPTTPTTPHPSVYTTVTGAESRIRMAFEAIFKKSSTLQDVEANAELVGDVVSSPEGYTPTIVPRSPSINKKVQLPRERVCDMSTEDQRLWEREEMSREIDFDTMMVWSRSRHPDTERERDSDDEFPQFMCHVDPAPFQLVERTSLLKVHSLFSTLGVSRAYVTAIGRLIGVVALTELRKAIEDVNSGALVQVQPELEAAPPSDSESAVLTKTQEANAPRPNK